MEHHAAQQQQPIEVKSSWENDWHPGNPSRFLFLIVIVARPNAGLLVYWLYYVAPVYFWAIWAHFHFSTSTWLDEQKKWNWQSHPSTHFLPVDYRVHVIVLNIPYLLIFSCFMYLGTIHLRRRKIFHDFWPPYRQQFFTTIRR